MKHTIHTADGDESVTAYWTSVPGLVVYRRPGGWVVGHFPTGTVVSVLYCQKRDQAKELALTLAGLVDWARIDIRKHEGLAAAVYGAEMLFHGGTTPWKVCSDLGAGGRCLRQLDHPGTHQAYGRTWRREEDDHRA